MPYEKCPACSTWTHYLNEVHKCPPKWDGVDADGEPFTAFGYDAPAAAEHFAEHGYEWDEESEIQVAVRSAGTDGPWNHLEVLREYEPTYSSSDISKPKGWELPDDEVER